MKAVVFKGVGDISLDAIDAYKTFDRRESGWVKVMISPVSA